MNIGVVVIGRNEGERLRKCLRSVVRRVVSVASRSTEGSAEVAHPFAAARARYEGLRRQNSGHIDFLGCHLVKSTINTCNENH